MDFLATYIPMDRRQAMASQSQLPEQTVGTTLFADISGFTPLTAALARELGRQRGAEELTHHLNRVYNALITEVHRYGGSVISFAGDAIICWFDQDEGWRATRCAFAMQSAMRPFQTILTPTGTTLSLAIKTALASGAVRRFRVGDPDIQYLDALAGQTVVHVAHAEKYAAKGEVVLAEQTALALGEALEIEQWRTDEQTGQRFAVVKQLRHAVTAVPWPPLTEEAIHLEETQRWLLPPIFERLRAGQVDYLAELRPATSLFLKFDGLDYDNDPQVGDKLNAYICWVQQIVAYYEGHVLQLTIGDKGSYLYAVFGAPIAHDDDPLRAVAVSLTLPILPDAFRFIKGVQIGISQGHMRVGAYGGDARRTYGVLGEETNMAARLMTQAGAGQIFVRQRVAEAVGGLCKLRDVGLIQVKGKDEPIRVYEVLGHVRSSTATTHLFTTPLIGRESELQQLETLVHRAASTGQIIRLSGGAGVGKSHLAMEVIRHAQRHGRRVVTGTCQSVLQSVTYAPWQQIFKTLLGLEQVETAAPQAILETLQQQLEVLNPLWAWRLPLLGDLLGLSLPDNPMTNTLDPKLRQDALFALVSEMLVAWATQQPLFLVLEDVHWLDKSSVALLTNISRRAAQAPLAILLIHRPPEEEGQPILPELETLAHVQNLELGELPSEALLQLLENQLDGRLSLLASSLIQNRSEGNPFFAQELANALREAGILHRNETQTWQIDSRTVEALHEAKCLKRMNGEWVLNEHASLAGVDIGVPDSIYGAVLARLDRLPESHKLTLKVASVVGRSFEVGLVYHTHPAQPDPHVLQTQTVDMANQDFIRPERPDPPPTDMTVSYLFRHNTTQEVVYDTLLFAQRQQLHQAIGRTLELFNPHQIAQIAHHAYLGHDWSRAMRYHIQAGQRARQLFANSEAIDHFRKALKSSEQLPLNDTQAQRLDSHLALGELLVSTNQYGAANEQLKRALTVARQLGDYQTQARVCRWLGRADELRGEYISALEWLQNGLYILEDEALETAEAAELQILAGLINSRQGNYQKALARCEKGISIAAHPDIQDGNALARAYNLHGHLYRLQGENTVAIQSFQKSLALAQDNNNIYAQAQAHNQIANAHFSLGRWSQAQQNYRQAQQIFHQLGDVYHSAMADINLGGIALNQGHLDEALNHYTVSLNQLELIGGSLWVRGVAHNNLGATYIRRGQLDQAYQHLYKSEHYFLYAQSRDFLPELYRHFAEAALHQGQDTQAAGFAVQALALARELKMRSEEGNSLRVWGQSVMGQGHLVVALTYLQESDAILEETQDEYEWARTQLVTAEVLYRQGDWVEAQRHLDRCEPIFERLETQWEQQQSDLLRQKMMAVSVAS